MSHHHDPEDHHHHHDDPHHHDPEAHPHDHAPHSPESAPMSFEDKTRKILDHWRRHNADHAKTYRDWAEKARDHGMDEVAGLIREIEEMTLAINAKVDAALEKLER